MHTLIFALGRRLVLVALMSLSLFGNALAQGDDPKGLITEIYRLVGTEGDVSIFADETMRKRFLSRRLQAALKAMDRRTPAGDAPNLDFDPISNSNDPSVHDLRINTEKQSPTTAIVVADFLSHQDAVRIALRYHLVRENGWKVDNIVASGKNEWDVRKIIETR